MGLWIIIRAVGAISTRVPAIAMTDAADIPAYAFSGKEPETRLMNKLTAHYKPKDKGMTPAQAAAIPAVKDEPPAEAGKTYDELMTRLNLIKP